MTQTSNSFATLQNYRDIQEFRGEQIINKKQHKNIYILFTWNNKSRQYAQESAEYTSVKLEIYDIRTKEELHV